MLRQKLLFTGLCIVTVCVVFWLLSQGLRLTLPPAHPLNRAWFAAISGMSLAFAALLCSILGKGRYRVALFLSSFCTLFFWVVMTPISVS